MEGVVVSRFEMEKSCRAIVAIMLAVLMLAAAGCAEQSGSGSQSPEATADVAAGDNTGGSSEPITLTLWHSYVGSTQTQLESAVEEFNETVGHEQGIVVEAVAMGSLGDLEAAVTDSAKGVINSADMPDIFSCYADKALELDELGVLCDLGDYFSEEERAQYVKSYLDAGVMGGKLLTLPIVAATEVLYIDNTALNEFVAANPQFEYTNATLGTWESLYDLSKAYYEWTDSRTPDTPWDGKGFMGVDELGNFLIISNKQLGVDIMDGAASEVHLDREVLHKIFTLYYNGMSLGYFDNVGRFCSDDVKTGDLAAYVGSSSSATYFPTFIEVDNQEAPIELLASPYPVFNGGEPFEIQQGAGMAVAKSDESKESAAAVFLKWFTDTPINVPYAMQSGYLPIKTAAYDSEQFSESLNELESGGELEQNMAKVYSVALTAISSGTTYAPVTFSASYSVRSLLKQSLLDAAAQGEADAAQYKAQGMDADAILGAINTEAKFEAWMASLSEELDSLGVTYTTV